MPDNELKYAFASAAAQGLLARGIDSTAAASIAWDAADALYDEGVRRGTIPADEPEEVDPANDPGPNPDANPPPAS